MKFIFITACSFLFFCLQSFSQVRLPRLIRDSMILQRDKKITLWGWAAPSEKVTIKFNSKTFKTTTTANGKWTTTLPAMKAGGPYTMAIDASNHMLLKDILMGDVWFCSGQSNMVHQMALHSERYAAEIASANDPQIRQFWIPTLTDLQKPQEDLPTGYWKTATATDVLQFSAVAYFFAKKLHDKYGVPIGLINASVGGTPIEAWTSEEGLKEFLVIMSTLEKNKDTAYVNGLNRKAVLSNRPPKSEDMGLLSAKPWYDTAYIPTGWRPINIPGYWEDQGIRNLDGIVWYRKEINVPAEMVGVPAKVFLGRIVDADALYVNGKLVGNTGYQYPQRRYAIASGILKAGKNSFVIRVINNSGKGGFVPDKPYYLVAGKDTVDLKGTWQYKVGQAFIPQQNAVNGVNAQSQPGALYNAMVAPVINYSIKGFLWYQGEANTFKPEEYTKLQPALIKDWRQKWNAADAPFLYVQLPGFMEMNYLPSESGWAAFREAQLSSLSVSNTAMAVAIDLGEWNDIHPDRKKEVGDRLALAAEKLAYGENLVYSGPIYQASEIKNKEIIISFTNIGSGLMANDGEALSEFAIAGADKKFVWAKARIEGDKVIVWNETITAPAYVRYAWADNPVNPNLFNKDGLPASPFRTDK